MQIAVIGYGNQGRAQALNMKDSGLDIIIGQRQGKSFDKAKKDNFEVFEISTAVKKADILYILLPDESQKEVYEKDILPFLKNQSLCFSHGFNIVFNQIIPPKNIDVIMVSPRANGHETRESYLSGKGVPAMISVFADVSGNATKIAKEIAKANNFSPLVNCSFAQETHEDLFSEQVILCGGLIELIKKASEVLLENNYPPEMAYYGALYELKHVVDYIHKNGIAKFNEVISNTAEYGEYTVGKKIIDDSVKQRMGQALANIESGEFTKELLEESKKGFPNLLKMRQETSNHPIEKIGKKLKKV